MFKALKDNKIIAISEKDSEFKFLVKDGVASDTEHTVDDYAQYNGEFILKGDVPPEPLKEKLLRLETEYQMPRYVREGILAEGSPYSDFTKARAQELEDIAEQIRRGDNEATE